MVTGTAQTYRLTSLVAAFDHPRGRSFVVQTYPRQIVDLYDQATMLPRWISATTPAQRALALATAIDGDADLDARLHVDLDEDVLQIVDAAAGHPDAGADGLLGASTAAAWHPDAAAHAAGTHRTITPQCVDAVPSWLHAELVDDAPPLVVGTAYTLAVFFASESGSAAADETWLPFPEGQDTLDVRVRVMSADFDVPADPQRLQIGRDGCSTARALFDIRPRERRRDDGTQAPHGLSVLVDVRGNFLQRLDLTFDRAEVPDLESYGRRPAAAAMLDERSVAIQLKPSEGGYELLAPQVCSDPIELRLTEEELCARIRKVRKVLLQAVKRPPIAFQLDIPPADGDALLRDLAFAGFRLFQAVFSGPEASSDLKRVRDWLCTRLEQDATTLQVVSTAFPVPWPLMYAVRRFDAEPLSWDNFIGMRHIVEQIPLAQLADLPAAPTIDSTPELGVRTLYDDGIDHAMPSRPVAAQRAYWGSRKVALVEGRTVDELVTQGLSSSATDKVLYLYCHAEASAVDPDDSKLIFSGSTSVSLGQLSVYAPTDDVLQSHPLVFINACESAQLTPEFYDGFVPYFLAKGARGVIGTECKTPGLFASEWAKAFFDELFAGRSVGRSVLTLRRRFLAEHNNPLGLLYGVHCDTDTVIAPALASAA
ncbi:CHAT domain-containing protein [Microbacterium sp.]|uniref:CHAT domain-containing protein n=1 Tax=Microbacterium sp. TaxID=51671 RepID=UPI0039E29995